MSMFWLAEIPGFPTYYKGGAVPAEFDGSEPPVEGGLFLLLACVAFAVFAIIFIWLEKRRARAQWRADDWPERPFPRYPVIPKPRRRWHDEKKVRPPSGKVPEAPLIREQSQATVPPSDIPNVEAAHKSSRGDCARLSCATTEEKQNAEPVEKN
jgi:hypothetical protein